jgi:ABC-type nickel/cobalt efflux system permease component RcnA
MMLAVSVSQWFGVAIAAVGLAITLSSRALSVAQVRSQPRWMHPWRNPERFSRAMFIVIGGGMVIAGILEAIGGIERLLP